MTFTAYPSSTSSVSMAALPASWPSASKAAPSRNWSARRIAGLEYMFIMMNAARYSVGLEGVGISERAYQTALAYAHERVQGTEAGLRGGARVAIVRHPDVRRMLMIMKSQTEAMRALAGVVAISLDAARLHPRTGERERHQAFADLMIPVVKGWCTENSVDIASLGIQVHGGVGFVEETGAAQFLRDARITPIYEGTTGIQANDLIGRKLARDGGSAARAVIAEMRDVGGHARRGGENGTACCGVFRRHRCAGAGDPLRGGELRNGHTRRFGWRRAPAQVVRHRGGRLAAAALGPDRAAAAAVHPRATAPTRGFYEAKISTARFYADYVLSQAAGLAHSIVHGAARRTGRGCALGRHGQALSAAASSA